jgi:hypothetical protein
LLEERPARESLELALLSERMFEYDSARCLADGRLDLPKISGVSTTGPATVPALDHNLLWDDALIMLRHTTAILQAVRTSSDWPTLKSQLPPLPKELTSLERRKHVALAVLLPNLEKAISRNYQIIAERRMAAAALAVRRFIVDNSGRKPIGLEELVPKYLPSVPQDPMAINAPLKYRTNEKEWLVYSTGDDGQDDAGAWRAGPTKQASQGVPDRWRAFDAVMHLQRKEQR